MTEGEESETPLDLIKCHDDPRAKNNKHRLKIFYVNINGLTTKKMEQLDMIQDIGNSDFICLTETHLYEEEGFPDIKDYIGYHTCENRKKSFGRNIKGVALYHKNSINNIKITEIFKDKGNLLIIKISSQDWKFLKELHLIVCYKEDRESKFKTKDYFENLKEHIINFKIQNVIIVGDLNGRIGWLNDNEHMKLKLRTSEDLTINTQGREIINFCNETKLIIMNGRLENGKCTYYKLQNDTVRKSVIDYLIVSDSVLRLDLLRKFEIYAPATYTDHSPMIIELNIETKEKEKLINKPELTQKLIKSDNKDHPYKWTEHNKERFDNDKFKQHCIELNEKLKKQYFTNKEIFQNLLTIKGQALMPSESEKPKFRPTIYSKDTRKHRQHYKSLVACWKKNGTHENLTEMLKVKRDLNKRIKTERRRNKEKRLFELKQAKDNHDHKKFWQLINKVKIKKQRIKSTLKAEDFKLQLEERDLQQTQITDKLITLMVDEKKLRQNKTLKDESDSLNSDITIEEITKSLKSMHNSKSGGPDGFVNEILKNNVQEITPVLLKLFNNILHDKEIPWNTSWIVPLYKNGENNDLSSYRCINLSSCVEKLLTKIIKVRLTNFCDNMGIISPLQTGFRKGNSVLDNIYILREIMRIYNNKKHELFLCFLDLSKAFDSIPTTRLKKKLQSILPESKVLSTIMNILDNKTYQVLYDGKTTESFQLRNGIPQGDSMSPILFNLYINDLLDRFEENENNNDPVNIENMKISILIYADDILLLSQSQHGMIKQIKIIQDYCCDNALKINYNKTKIMIRNPKSKYSSLTISTKDEIKTIEVVNEYKYLGMWFTKNNRKHLDNLEKSGRKSSFMTTKLLKEFGEINGYLLRDTFEMLTLSKIRYCGEFCFDDNLKNLNKLQYQFYKRFCHLKVTTPNYCLIGEFGIKPIEVHFYKAALRYWGKIVTADENSLVRKIYHSIYENINEPYYSKTWVSKIKKLLHKLQLDELWLKQYDTDRNISKILIDKRLNEYCREEWISSARHSHKGNNYLQLARFELGLKMYLNFVVTDKSIGHMLKIRTGNHTLSVEVDRYRNRKTYDECICKSCEQEEIEDLFHVIVVCPKFSELRKKSIPFMINHNKAEFYTKMNKLNIKEIKQTSDFMQTVEDSRIK